MPATTDRYSPAVAAVLSGIALKAVHNALDKRIIEPHARTAGKRSSRTLSAADVLRLKLWHDVGAILSHERRQRLFDEIESRPGARRIKVDPLVIVDVGEARKQISSRARDLDAAEAAVTCSAAVLGSEPVFAGTRIPVHLIASMLRHGVDEGEILDGYPKLEREHLALARLWAEAHPRRGRPKSSLTGDGVTATSRISLPLAGDPGPKASRISPRP